MTRYRYLVEQAGTEWYLTTLEAGDDDGHAVRVESEDEAKALAGQDPNAPEAGLRWRDPPDEWQPDATALSGWMDDGVEANL